MPKTKELTPEQLLKLSQDIDSLINEIKDRKQHVQEFKKKQIELISTL